MSRKRSFGKKNKILGTPTHNACVDLTLDTHGPTVEVDDLVEFRSTLVNFEFLTTDRDWIDYKAWGDFDTSNAGVNHDLVGDTYVRAPWVDSRFTVDQTLSPTGNVFDGYKFHFSFRDDVWNEREVTVIYDSSRTMLVELEDKAFSLADLMVQSFGDEIGIEYASSDLLIPEEEKVLPPTVQKLFEMLLSAQIKSSTSVMNFLLTEDLGNENGEIVVDFPVLETLSYHEDSFQVAKFIYTEDFYSKDSAQLAVAIDDSVHTISHAEQFMLGTDIGDEDSQLWQTAKLVEKDILLSSDEMIIGNISDVVYKVDTGVVIDNPPVEIIEGLKVQYLFEIIVNLQLTAESQTLNMIAVDEEFCIDDFAEMSTFGSDKGIDYEWAWNDADLLYEDLAWSTDRLEFNVFADYFGSSVEFGVLGVFGTEIGEIPSPTWIFEIILTENILGIDISDLLISDSEIGLISDNSELSQFSMDAAISEDLLVQFEKNAFDELTSTYSAALDLVSSEIYKVLELSEVLLGISDTVISEDLLVQFEKNVFDELNSTYSAVVDLISSENYIVQDLSEILLGISDIGISEDVLIQFEKNVFDSVIGNADAVLDVLGSDIEIFISERVIQEIILEDRLVADINRFIDADLLQTDQSDFVVESGVINIPVSTDFRSIEEAVVEIDVVCTYSASFDWEIEIIVPETYKEIFVFDVLESFEKSYGIDVLADDFAEIEDFATIFIPVTETVDYFEKAIPVVKLPVLEVVNYSEIPNIGLYSEDLLSVEDYVALTIPAVEKVNYNTAYRLLVTFPVIESFIATETHSLGLILTDEYNTIDQAVIQVDVWVNYVATERQTLLELILAVEHAKVYEIADLCIAASDFAIPDESAVLVPCVFEVGDVDDRAYPATRHLVKEYGIVKELGEILLDTSDLVVLNDHVIVSLYSEDWFDVEETYEIEDVTDVYEFTVYDYVVGYDFANGLFLMIDDSAVIVEEPIVAVLSSDLGKSFDYHAKEFTVVDWGNYCFNTVIYDPSITERKLIYWWQEGYPGGYQDAYGYYPNPKWGQDIQPGEYDNTDLIPFLNPKSIISWVSGTHGNNYGRRYFTDYASADPYVYNLGSHSWSLAALDKDYLVIGSNCYFDVGAEHNSSHYVAYDVPLDLPGDFFESVTFRYTLTISYSTTITSGYYIVPLDDDFVDNLEDYHDNSWSWYIPCSVLSSLRLDLRDVFPDIFDDIVSAQIDISIAASMVVNSKYSIPTSAWLEFREYGGILNGVNPEYLKYRQPTLYGILDGWFVPIDEVVPENIQYKLYVNMGCGPDDEYNREPQNDMERFVYEKKKRYAHLDIYANYTGDIDPSTEWAVIEPSIFEIGNIKEHAWYDMLYTARDKAVEVSSGMVEVAAEDFIVVNDVAINSLFSFEIGDYIEHFNLDVVFTVRDAGFSCLNTIIYDPTITQRDLLYWWQSYDISTGFQTEIGANPLWLKDIKPGDFDYPFKETDVQYGTVISCTKHLFRNFNENVIAHFYYDNSTPYYYLRNDNFRRLCYGSAKQIELTIEMETHPDTVIPNYHTYADHIDIYHKTFLPADSARFKVYIYRNTSPRRSVAVSNITYLISDYIHNLSQEIVHVKLLENEVIILEDYFDDVQENDSFYIDILAIDASGTPVTNRLWAVTSYWYGECITLTPTETYLKYRGPKVYTDGWFIPIDVVVPENIQYKLYLNMGCGPDEEFDREPTNDMERFVYEKKKRYSHLDIIANYTGDIEPVYEEPVISFFPVETGKYLDIVSDRTFTIPDFGSSCVNTIIYDPTITERDLCYWWEMPYKTTGYQAELGENPLWTKSIKPGDPDYPYPIGSEHYGEEIDYWVAVDVTQSLYVTYYDDHVYGPGDNKPYPGSWHQTTSTPIDYYKEGWSTNEVEIYLLVTKGTTLSFKNLYVGGSTSMVFGTTSNLVQYVRIIQRWPKSSISGDYYYMSYNISASAPGGMGEITTAVDTVDCTEIFSTIHDDADFIIALVLYAEVYRSRWWSGNTYVLQGSFHVTGDVGPLDIYARSRKAKAYIDGWFITVDEVVPENISYKLYLNMGCGPDSDLPGMWDDPNEPQDRMERFVYEKKKKYSYLNIIANYTGDIEPVNEEAVISFYKDIRLHAWEHITDFSFTAHEFVVPCINTIVYSTDIQQRDLLFWWQQGYQAVKGVKRLNPLWEQPIRPEDIDYPYYAGDSQYGEIIPYYGGYVNTYASWYCKEGWYGEGHDENVPQYVSGWDPTTSIPAVTQHYNWTDMTVVKTDTQVLFTSEDHIFTMETFNIDVTEKYLLTATYIPWNTIFTLSVVWYKYDPEVPGEYIKAGILVLPFSLQIESQVWDVDNVRHTVYKFVPASSEINAMDIFSEIRDQDYFGVELQCNFSWTGRFYEGSYYEIDAQYFYYGKWAMANAQYRQIRLQYIQDTDEWFIPQDILYYEPLDFKLYLNMGCGVVESEDWVPVSPLDKFVQDKMKKYSFLDLKETFPGGHADIQEDVIISLYAKLIYSYEEYCEIEKEEIPYELYVNDYGFLCEDIVIYSKSDIQNRELMFWWEDGYPITKPKKYVKNALLGYPIVPGDFDYPYTEMDDEYGTIINPNWGRSLNWKNDLGKFNKSFVHTSTSPTYRYFVVPLVKISDGLKLTLNGKLSISRGELRAHFCYLTGNAPGLKTGVEIVYPSYAPYTDGVSSDYIVTMDNPYASTAPDEYEFNLTKTYSMMDIANYWTTWNDSYAENVYLGVVIRLKAYSSITSWYLTDAEFIYDITSMESYNSEYTSVRAWKMLEPINKEFITTDFYEDFFGFKFYTNLGCGPSMDAWPIKTDDPFERWIFRKAGTGNYNLDYLFDGNYGYVEETPIIDLAETEHGTIHIHWWFNNLEFLVTDSLTFSEYSELNLLAEDEFISNDDFVTFDFALSEVGKVSRVIHQFVTMDLFETGKIEIVPQYDIIGSDIGEISGDTLVSFEYEDSGEVKVLRDIENIFTVYDKATLFGQNLLNIPIDGSYGSDAETIIDFQFITKVSSEEHHNEYNFLFVYDDGLPAVKPVVQGVYDHVGLSIDDAVIVPAVKYIAKAREYVKPDRHEVYRDVGYVCFWVQVVAYNYVIDWLVGHYVDYYVDMIKADFLRYTTCFGMPPGGWPPIEDYPTPHIIPGDYPVPGHIDPKHPKEGYRDKHPEYIPTEPEVYPGYIVIPVDSKLIYILNPGDPPEPYEWIGGTAIFLTKFISDEDMQGALQVVDAFYFALFDADGNRVSDIQYMTLTDYVDEDGTINKGTSYGAMIFYDVEPNTTYYIKETDSEGNLYTTQFVSEHSGNTYLLPVEGLKCTTGDEGSCVYAGNLTNSVSSTGTGGKPLPSGGGGSNYNPGDPGSGYKPGSGRSGDGKDPIRSKGGGGGKDPRGKTYPPRVDSWYFPPYSEEPPEILEPIDVPGYDGRLHRVFDHGYLKTDLVTNIPVDMMGFSWEYHYIPASYLLDLIGFKIEFIDDFDFELEEPFRFSFDEFVFEIDEPFRLDSVEFIIEAESPFRFDEEYFKYDLYTEPILLDEIYFELESEFDAFQFEQIDYSGEQGDPTPEVVPNVLTYDGQEHVLVQNRGQSGIIYYQIGEEPWSPVIPKRTEAGSYQVKWYALASLLYTGYGSKSRYLVTNAMIEKAAPEYTIQAFSAMYLEYTVVEFIYVGDGQIKCESGTPEYCTCEIISIVPEISDTGLSMSRVKISVYGLNCGNGNIIVSSDAGDNYKAGNTMVDCAVVAGFIKYEVTDVEVDYTGSSVGSDIKVYGPSQYQIFYSTEVITEESENLRSYPDFYVDAGAYNIYFVIQAVNYESVYGRYVLTINPAPQQIMIIPAHPEYNTLPQSLIEAVYGVQGTIWFSLDKTSWDVSYPMGRYPGDYEIYWYSIGDSNHYDEASADDPNVLIAQIDKMEIVGHIDDVVIDLAKSDALQVIVPTPSDGEITVTLSNYSLADVAYSNKVITLTAFITGEVFVYVNQAEGTMYKEHNFTFRAQIIDTRIVYVTTTVVAEYTGARINESGVLVIEPSSYVIRYSKTPITSATPIADLPTSPAFYTNIGTYQIYFVITAYGYVPAYGSFELEIVPQET